MTFKIQKKRMQKLFLTFSFNDIFKKLIINYSSAKGDFIIHYSLKNPVELNE